MHASLLYSFNLFLITWGLVYANITKPTTAISVTFGIVAIATNLSGVI